jgi:hypothetical protein
MPRRSVTARDRPIGVSDSGRARVLDDVSISNGGPPVPSRAIVAEVISYIQTRLFSCREIPSNIPGWHPCALALAVLLCGHGGGHVRRRRF